MESPGLHHQRCGVARGLEALRDELLAKGLAEDVPAARAFWDKAEATRRERGRCGRADEARACKVELRYIYEVFRNTPKELVFAQTLLGFEIAAADPRVVAINFVGGRTTHRPWPTMQSTCAWSVSYASFIPRFMSACMRASLRQGSCRRKVSAAMSGSPWSRRGPTASAMAWTSCTKTVLMSCLKNMADKGVLVEINLTSNEVILGIERQAATPSPTYRKFGVPVALSTDDEGVSRIDLTHEYATRRRDLWSRYADLKELVRNSLAYSFLPGASLWNDKGGYARFVPDCLSDVPGPDEPSSPCASFLASSEKAAQQWELERRFQAFEASL